MRQAWVLRWSFLAVASTSAPTARSQEDNHNTNSSNILGHPSTAHPQEGDHVNQKCTLCHNDAIMDLPNNTPINDGLLAGQSCTQINQWAGILFTSSSQECQTIQSLGTMCGCPLDERDGHKPCTLCPDGQLASKPDKALPVFSDLAVFAETIGTSPTCGMFQAYLLSSSSSEDRLCSVAHDYMADYCGCHRDSPISTTKTDAAGQCSICSSTEDRMLYPNRTLNMEGFPFETCREVGEAASLLLLEGSITCESLKGFGHFCGCPTTTTDQTAKRNRCSLCSDGSAVPLRDKACPNLKDAFGGFTPTCAIVESSLLSTSEAGSDECEAVQLFGSYCGCPSIDNHCLYCPEMDRIPPSYANKTINEFATYFGDELSTTSITCEDAWLTQFQLRPHEQQCFFGRHGSYLCGCNGGESKYLDAKTFAHKVALAWIPRFTGSLSVLGSLSIMVDVLRDATKRMKVYNRLVFLLSCTDIMASTAMALSTWPIEATSVSLGASGTKGTCQWQGFFTEMAAASLFFNLMLSTYFYLSLRLAWKERRIRRYQGLFYTLPILIGLGLAIWGLPYYKSVSTWCHIDVPPGADSWLPVTALVLVPSLTVSILSTGMMVSIYLKVRHQSKRMARWQFRGSVSSLSPEEDPQRRRDDQQMSAKLDQQVFWQAFLFLSAFYVSHTVQAYVAFHAWSEPYLRDQPADIYPVWVLHVTLTPLQGFWNAFIYFRPRILQRWRRLRRQDRVRRRQPENSSSSSRSFKVNDEANESHPIEITLDSVPDEEYVGRVN